MVNKDRLIPMLGDLIIVLSQPDQMVERLHDTNLTVSQLLRQFAVELAEKLDKNLYEKDLFSSLIEEYDNKNISPTES